MEVAGAWPTFARWPNDAAGRWRNSRAERGSVAIKLYQLLNRSWPDRVIADVPRLQGAGWPRYYAGPQTALKHMSALVNQSGRRDGCSRCACPAAGLDVGRPFDPDGGLPAYRRLSEALATESWYLATLRDKPAVAKRLMHVLGTSAYVRIC